MPILDRTRTEVRIFIALPSDVQEERKRLKLVIEQLNQGLAKQLGLTLELWRWENVAPDLGRPQDVIFEQLPPADWDIFVGILWLRFGSETGAVDPDTKQPYHSGTEEEFKAAYRERQASHTGWPKVMFYRCTRPPIDIVNLDTAQLDRVKKFFDGFAPTGTHPGLIQHYNQPEDFERFVRDHLEKWLWEFPKTVAQTPDHQPTQLKPDDKILPIISALPIVDRELERNLFQKILKRETNVRGLVIHSRGEGGWGKSVLLQIFEKESVDYQALPTEVFFFDPSDTGADWLFIMDLTTRRLGVEHFPRYASARATIYSKEPREQTVDYQEIYTQTASSSAEQQQEIGETFNVVRIQSSYSVERSEPIQVDITKIFLQELESFPQPIQVVWLVDAVDRIDRDTQEWLINMFARIAQGTLTKVILVAASRHALYHHPSWKGKVQEIDVCRFEKSAIPQLLLHAGWIDRIEGVEKACEELAELLFKKTNGKPLDICTYLQTRRA
jgi:hypothetical protein